MKRLTALAVALLATTVAASPSVPNDDRTIVHVLNRIAFGPRPSDVQKVRSVGLDRYIEEQLHPERIPDEGVKARLADLHTIGLSQSAIAEQFEKPVLEARKQKKAQGKADDNAGGDEPKAPDPVQVKANTVVVELGEQKMLRAIYSDRQLEEVLTDFWFNHFNVDARKGRDRFFLTEYERDVIRPHVLGKFRDLLGATAKSPAMLFYLDNWMSVDPAGPHPPAGAGSPRIVRGAFGRPVLIVPPAQRAQAQNPNAPKGLNENYAREIMELHTLGVDGGYTQKDVTEVARALTGWTIEKPGQGGYSFRFEPRIHDNGQKTILGRVIPAGGGERDGEQVLDLLARHPSTAKFIATKLARRFVSDNPPPALVDRVAARFTATDGDLREVMRTLLTSPEFLSPDAAGAKMKTPFEFVASALRASNAEVWNATPLVRAMQQLGMPLYQCQPPTGYKDTADAWMNTGALVGRMNFAVQLAENRLPGIAARADAMSLGSPEFQRR